MTFLAVARCPALESVGVGLTLGGRGAGCSTWGGGKGAGWQGSGRANTDRSHQLLTHWCKSCVGGEGSGQPGAELRLEVPALILPPPHPTALLCPSPRTLPAASSAALAVGPGGFSEAPTPAPYTRDPRPSAAWHWLCPRTRDAPAGLPGPVPCMSLAPRLPHWLPAPRGCWLCQSRL